MLIHSGFNIYSKRKSKGIIPEKIIMVLKSIKLKLLMLWLNISLISMEK